mmetsp:Transcript_18216/g.47520  ORF Transcript_18216/g.47520 Transcript_18216/m.47520 type:complete len:499 (+) Transcript_18216:99-1595(+)
MGAACGSPRAHAALHDGDTHDRDEVLGKEAFVAVRREPIAPAIASPCPPKQPRAGAARARAAQPLPEGCIRPAWLGHTRRSRLLAVYRAAFKARPDLRRNVRSIAPVVATFKKAAAGHDVSAMSTLLVSRTGENRAVAGLAMVFLAKYGTADECRAVAWEAAERMTRCESARKQAFSLLATEGAALALSGRPGAATAWDHLLPAPDVLAEAAVADVQERDGGQSAAYAAVAEGSTEAAALQRVLEACEAYLDQHKEAAFASAMQEPARLYFHLTGSTFHRDHVNVHGINGYLGILRGSRNIQLPTVIMPDDGATYMGCTDFWSGLSDAAWVEFRKAENFGKAFEGIPAFRQLALGSQPAEYVTKTEIAAGKWIGGNAAKLEGRAARGDGDLAVYTDRFMSFFVKERVVRQMFETLNAETSPAFVGFGRSCEMLFPLFRVHAGVDEADAPSLVEYLYDDMITTLDVDGAQAFFAWLGVMDPPSSIPAGDDDEHAPGGAG